MRRDRHGDQGIFSWPAARIGTGNGVTPIDLFFAYDVAGDEDPRYERIAAVLTRR